MKKNLKVLSSAALASALAVPAVAGVAPQTVDAAENIETIAFSYDGEGYTVSYADYASALLDGEGDLYDKITSDSFSVAAVGIGDGVYVTYNALATAKLDNPETSTLELLEDLAADEDNLVDEDTVDSWDEYEAPSDSTGEVMVDSVEVLNLKQIQVTLSSEVEETDELTNTDNYSLEDEDDEDYSFEDVTVDGDTVTLTLEEHVPNQTDATFEMDDVVLGETVTEDLSFFDTTVPEVNEAAVIGNDTVKVSFSEPLAVEKNEDDEWVTVEGGDSVEDSFELSQGNDTLFVRNVEFVKNNTEANVEVYSTFEEGTVDFSIDNELEDYAGFSLIGGDYELEVEEDNEAPEVVEYKDATRNSVTLVFNEDIEIADDATFESFYHTNTSNTVVEDTDEDKAGNQIGATVDGNELTLDFGDNELPEGTAYVYVDGEAILDKWDNLNESTIRQEVQVTVDETAPELLEVESDSETEATLTFSEDIDADSVDEDDFQILDADGEEEEDIVDDVTVDGDEITLTFSEELSGDKAVVVSDIEDLAGNEIEETTKEFFVDDSTAIDVDDVTSTLYTDDEDVYTLVVNFPEEMATEGQYSVADLDKYQINDVNLDESDVEASIEVIDNRQAVEITIPTDNEEGLTVDSEDTLEVARVADAAGNPTNEFSFDVDIADATDISLDAEATSTDTVEVTINDRVDLEADDFDFEIGGVDVDIEEVSTELDDGDTVATFVLEDEFNHEVDNVTLSIVADPDTTNSYDLQIASGEVTIADGVSPELGNANDDDEISREDTDVTNVQSVELTFTEDVEGNADALGNYLDVEGYTFVTVDDLSELDEDEFTIASISGDSATVTVYVYDAENNDFTIDLDPSRFLEDEQGNDAVFPDTITVPEEEE
ncbi:Ig-like domain-containing protein [Halobacillus litoralis]|uniref:Ig-like domain-containing protein n=1 Tax=Halobacillus litoralis TaxID=45668 RepID=UPI001CD25637|nr:Ig-like domain-containing protein [Halobacillus litoralis]MCA0970980.1 Ig-like domain-containing protein [Halobacillus litoralis]